MRVSITTYPLRMASACQAVKSILYSPHNVPSAVVLVLAEDEFGGRRQLSRSFYPLLDRGLEVLWIPHAMGPYGKLLPTIAAFPHDVMVVADDDVLYPANWLLGLVRAHRDNPRAIVGHRGWEVRFASPRELAPYASWSRATTKADHGRVLLTGTGGILYPPGSLPAEASDWQLARRLCPQNDDIWAHAMARIAGTPMMVTSDRSVDFPATWRTGNRAGLMASNVLGGGNDPQLKAVYDHFGLWAEDTRLLHGDNSRSRSSPARSSP
jgi:hypothetical protein